MLKADKHGKFPSEADIEDVLTSAVFGSLCYLDDKECSLGLCLLKNFLKKARFGRSGEKNTTFIEIVEEIQSVKYQFWPTLGWKEPDLIIECHGNNRQQWTLIIEAKYGAPKSGTGEVSESDSDNSDGESKEYHDQLADYYEIQNEKQKKEECKGDLYLLYVTHHTSFPTNDIESSLNKLNKQNDHNADDRLGWLPWRELSPLIQAQIDAGLKDNHRGKMELLEDLYASLWKRGLAPFTGEWGKRMGRTTPVLPKKPNIIYYVNMENNKGGQNGR